MLNDQKRRSILILLVCPLLVFILAVIVIAENAFRTSQSALTTIFEDRVLPLRDLKIIADMYAVNVVDTAHKACSGALSRENALQNIHIARKTINNRWHAYLATYLVEKERALVEELRPKLTTADRAVERLAGLLQSSGDADLADFVSHNLYPAIDPVSNTLSRLIDLQIEVTQQTVESTINSFETSRRQQLIALISVAMILSFMVSWLVW